MKHSVTGDVLELSYPDELGQSSLILNGEVIETVLFSDDNGGSVTIGDRRIFSRWKDFTEYLVQILIDRYPV